MERLDLRLNPFQVRTPEDMHPEDVVQLFVERDFAPFFKVQEQGHAMLVGPRGCGKSMIFRFMMPDCQRIYRDRSVHDLDYLGVLVRFKNSAPNVTELTGLRDKHAYRTLNEHMLTVYVASGLFGALSNAFGALPELSQPISTFYSKCFEPIAREAGWQPSSGDLEDPSRAPLEAIARACGEMSRAMSQYLRRTAVLPDRAVPYQGPLCGYYDFLLPLIRGLYSCSVIKSAPIYLLLDDADYLSDIQTRVLNTWIASREGFASLKISTQYQYKTYRTIDSLPIQAPHDFQEIDATDLYTNRSAYVRRMRDIVQKRLLAGGINVRPEDFFPPNAGQEAAIEALKGEIRLRPHRGFRIDDDVTRYARPEYFRKLAGTAKNTSTYSYAGFEQLLHISSGIVRAFLESADKMFDEEKSENPSQPIKSIPYQRQDKVVRKEADRLMFDEIDKIAKGEDDDSVAENAIEAPADRAVRLNNLLRALGGLFRQKLISDDSERRVFSVAISSRPDPAILEVFDLGVRYGYFHRSTIGNKEGTGRQRLYVLTRRLAPHFSLDPSSFAGYLWMSNEKLLEAIQDPDRFLRRVKDQGVGGLFDEGQLPLFDQMGTSA